MRICHITTVHPATDSRIFHRMCRGLASHGHAVTVVAPAAPTEHGAVRMSSYNERIKSARRMRRMVLALQAARREAVDVYHFHDPELIFLGLALKALKRSRAVVYDVHEDYPAMMLEKHWIATPLRSSAAKAVRLANVVAGRCFDGIVTADPGVEGDFKAAGVDKTLVYYNFPQLSLFRPAADGMVAKKADLIYLGGMSERSGTFVLLDALVLLGERGVRPSLRLGGYTDGEAGLREIREGIHRRGLDGQVEMVGRMPHTQVPEWIASGRIGLVPFRPIDKFMKNIPSKMFEYWACGLPVIASDLPPIRQFLVEGENGVLARPASAEDLARSIESLLERPDEIDAMGRGGRRAVEERWNNDRQVEGLVRFYERICER